MTFTIQCTCGKSILVNEKAIGTTAHCTSCQASIAVTAPKKRPVICHEIDFEIFGDDMQLVEVELDPNET